MGSRVEGLKIQTQASISNAQQFLHPQRGDNSYLSDLGAEWGGSMTVCKTLAYPELSESSSLEESLSPQLLTALMVFSAPLWGPGQAEVWNKFSLSTDPLSFPWGLWVSPRHMIWGPAHWSPGVWAAIGDTCMLSHVSRFATPWTVGWQAPLSMGFSKQKYWSGLPCPPSGDLPDPKMESRTPVSPALQADHKNDFKAARILIGIAMNL